jgi:hypothetical protein
VKGEFVHLQMIAFSKLIIIDRIESFETATTTIMRQLIHVAVGGNFRPLLYCLSNRNDVLDDRDYWKVDRVFNVSRLKTQEQRTRIPCKSIGIVSPKF